MQPTQDHDGHLPGRFYPDRCMECPEMLYEDYGACRGRCAACSGAARCMVEYGTDPRDTEMIKFPEEVAPEEVNAWAEEILQMVIQHGGGN